MSEDTVNRKWVIDYFSDRYTEAQVIEALRIMKDNGADVDPDSDEFSLDITEELEGIFKAVGAALDNQKKLSSSDSLTVQEAVELAASVSPLVNRQMMAAMIRIVTEGAITEASTLLQIRKKVIERVMSQGNQAIARSLHANTQESTDYLRQLADDDNKIDNLLAGYGFDSHRFDVDAFLEEVRQGSDKVRQDIKALPPTTSPSTFDVDAFLLESSR